jgi:2-phosphosulfolactate phosphatase
LTPEHLQDKAVVVFDVLRATTTIATALAAGVREIRICQSIAAAIEAARGWNTSPRPLLCGEVDCLAPPGFDLGNSPGAFHRQNYEGRTLCMSTTNGTRALAAASTARALLAGALVNAAAVAQRLDQLSLDVTLLCAGTNGAMAMEDVIGCGAVMEELEKLRSVEAASDAAKMALRLFTASKADLRAALADARGGRNVIAAALNEDVDYAARLNSLDVVGVVRDGPLRAMAQ